jgi:hypothetical protein
MSLHCNAADLLAQARRLIACGRASDARPLLIDAAAVFLQSGDQAGYGAARDLQEEIGLILRSSRTKG